MSYQRQSNRDVLALWPYEAKRECRAGAFSSGFSNGFDVRHCDLVVRRVGGDEIASAATIGMANAGQEESIPVSVEPAARPDWEERFWEWLEYAGKRVGVPSLVVGLIALCVSVASLYVVIANYKLTLAGNRPELASNGFDIELAVRPPHVIVHLENIGRKIARRGTANLFDHL